MSTHASPAGAVGAAPAATGPTAAPRDLAGWVAAWRAQEIPVLARTAQALEEWRASEDHADARTLAALIAGDPLMTLKLLAHAGLHRHARANADAETVTEALVMMGICPFFRAFGPQPSVESVLAPRPGALDGLQRVLRRAERAAQFALGFAVHRHDPDVAVIHEAALLHDFAEMLLWCHAPSLALALCSRQALDPQLRSLDAQRALLHVELPMLQHALMLEWRLPELLVEMADDHRARLPKVRSVMLAIRLARHTAVDWQNPAVPDDVKDIAVHLNLAPEPTLALLHELDS